MRDLLVSVLAAAALVALGLAALAAVTLAPFVVALQAADARHRSAACWGVVALAGSAGALLLAVGLLRAGVPGWLAAVAVLSLAWAAPVAARRAEPADPGRLGAHRR